MWCRLRELLHKWRRNQKPTHLKTGEWGERVAADHLKRQGYRVVGRRVRVGRGEIDLVARQGQQLVFVEVKTRAREGQTRPAEAVGYRKRRLLAQCGVRYARRLRGCAASFRFDIIEVEGRCFEKSPDVTHIVRAFDRHGKWR